MSRNSLSTSILFCVDYGTTELLIKDNLILFVNLLQSFLHSQMDSVQEEIGNNGSDICSGRLYPLYIANLQQTNKVENSTVIIIIIIFTRPKPRPNGIVGPRYRYSESYMQKTCDVVGKAILAKKNLQKKCINRDKM